MVQAQSCQSVQGGKKKSCVLFVKAGSTEHLSNAWEPVHLSLSPLWCSLDCFHNSMVLVLQNKSFLNHKHRNNFLKELITFRDNNHSCE